MIDITCEAIELENTTDKIRVLNGHPAKQPVPQIIFRFLLESMSMLLKTEDPHSSKDPSSPTTIAVSKAFFSSFY